MVYGYERFRAGQAQTQVRAIESEEAEWRMAWSECCWVDPCDEEQYGYSLVV